MMGTKPVLTCAISLALYLVPGLARGVQSAPPADRADAGRIVRYEKEHSDARLEPVRLDGQAGLAVVFEGTKDLHYYAREETAPSPGLQLKVEASSSSITFGKAAFLKLDERSVYNFAKKGKIPAIKIGKQWRFRRSQLDKLFNKG